MAIELSSLITEKYSWGEKWRPRSLQALIIPKDSTNIFESSIAKGEVPNTLLLGKPVSGKATLGRILVNTIIKSKTDLLYLNGSTQRGIDIVRDQIEDFLKTIIYGESKIKIVFIDEADYLTQDAQAALRNVIESYSDYGRFILTANYESKISDAIMSRMQTFRFKELPKPYILQYCANILKNEKIEYDEDEVLKVIHTHHPDVRKIVGILQAKSESGKLSIELADIESHEAKLRSLLTDLFEAIKTKASGRVDQLMMSTRTILSENTIDYRSLYEKIESDPSVPAWAKIILYKYYEMLSNSASPLMNYMSMLSSVIIEGNKERNMIA